VPKNINFLQQIINPSLDRMGFAWIDVFAFGTKTPWLDGAVNGYRLQSLVEHFGGL
jgi:hypothetical protein